jgi:uncharacterized membrane protein YeaQ/YmgE (transglycosylase-associated protein family)
MKEKKNGIIQAVVGLIILIIGIVLCVNTYVVKGNKAYAFSLLAAIIGAVVLISGICSMFLITVWNITCIYNFYNL